ncbi:multiple sugar transport system substrate-binding protein [Nonomuraea maritima]|uniref:Multiple sugar transport system substrate-binding protein n=1 Tax=Nonomuraea maritima TaxID=683260 RepID=A0A1G8ZDT7_9ACTN|nr:ABC transporter substrate-binding protein [Nonomuraea maritima]SDK12340.1 multiple sugar transport system substrate-binding protein [Nonomuraea maritima]
MLRPLPLLMAVLLAAGCAASGDDDGGAQGTGGTGPITFATGRDTTAYLQPLLDRWNQAHPAEKVTLLELPEAADEQRAQMVANLQARSSQYDVLGLDVILTAEFAENGWIIPLERGLFPLDRFLPPVVETAIYKNKLWAVPYTSNAGLLYYRTDLVDKPPRTWAELRDQAREITKKRKIGGYAGQFLAYEGLTVNFSEAVQSAGGELVSRDGTEVTLSPSVGATALGFLLQGLREGWIPQESLTYKEEESRLAFQEGRLAFARNWPHAYGPAKAELGDKVAVTRLPGLNGPGSSTLGGANLAVSAFSKHQQTAQEFIRYFTSLENERRVLTEGSFPPVWTELYDDPELVERFPYLPVLKESILAARARPVNANYNQLSLVIASSVAKALGNPTPESAADVAVSMKSELEEIIRTQ